MRIDLASPPRVGGLYETRLIPAGYVDITNENRYASLANEIEDSPAAKSARLKPILEDMARGVPTTLSEPCEEFVCVDRELGKVPSTEDDSAPPASQMSALPPARGENKKPASQPASSDLPDGANGEGEKSGGAGEDDKEAPKDAAAEEMAPLPLGTYNRALAPLPLEFNPNRSSVS